MAGKMPWFSFYPADWLGDVALRAVSCGARGLWIDMICLMDKSPKRGVLLTSTGNQMTEEILGKFSRVSPAEVSGYIAELVEMEVCSRDKHGNIFSRRMTRDETTRNIQNLRAQAKYRKIKENSTTILSKASHNSPQNLAGELELDSELDSELEIKLPPFIPPQAGESKKPKSNPNPVKSKATPEHIELIAVWKSHGLADTERAGQGYYAPSAAAQITTAIAEHGIEPIKSAIASYAARLKTKPDWRSYAVQFSTFFGPAKQIWRDHLPGDAPAPPQKNLTAGPTFKIPSQAIQPDDPANPKKYYSRILPQQPAQPKPKPEPTKD